MANFSLLAKMGLDTKAFQKGLKKSESSVKKFKNIFMGAIAKVAGALAAATLTKQMISLSMAAEEVASKFNEVLGPAADKTNEKITQLMQTIPATRAELQDSVATIASMAKSFGMSGQAAADFSIAMTKISGDLASFHNMSPDEIFTKMAAAITGEFEPLKRLGIVINEARLKQEAFNLGMGDGKAALTAQQKAIAVQNIVLKDMGAALGNAALTSKSAANQAKFLKARVEELKTQIGDNLRPAVVKTMEALDGLTGFIQNNIGAVIALTKRILAYVAAKKAISLVLAAMKAYKAATVSASVSTGVLTVSMKFLKRAVQGLLASTGIGLLVVAIGELGIVAMDAATKMGGSADEMSNAMIQAGADIEDTVALVQKSTRAATSSAAGFDTLTGSVRGTSGAFREATRSAEDFFSAVNRKVIELQQAQIKSLELQKLELELAGNDAAAKKLGKEIERRNQILELMRKYNISLLEAEKLIERIEGKVKDKTSVEKAAEKLKQLELELIRAQAAGEKKLTKELERKISILRSALEIQKEHNISLEEAFKLAKKIYDQNEGEGEGADTRGDMARGLQGEDLRKAASAAGKEDGIRFERMGDGMFQQFVNGRNFFYYSFLRLIVNLQKL